MGKIYLFIVLLFILFPFSNQVGYVWKTLNSFVSGLIQRRKCIIKFLLISFFVYGNFAIAQISTVPFTTVGNSTWTCPVGVTSITVQCRGGGGGGGGVNATVGAASGGGSGGSYSSSTVTVVPGTTYSITVGAGGIAGANTGGNGGAGGSSSFSLTSVVAVGGSGGTGASTAIGATGGVGTTTGNTAGINFAGGDGAAGTVSSIGGGGGGGAGDANSGGNASGGSTAGTGGVAGGGNGATGVSNVAGGTGSAIGGGGSGTRSTGTARAGGVGGRGQVNIIYTNPPVIVENFPNQTFCTTTYPTAYNTVNFSLIETAATNFDASQASQTIVLTLPAGFLFNLAAGPTVTRNTAAPGQDVTINGFSWTTTAITVTVTTAATQNNIDEINFNNFQIQATAASSGDLVRTGGTFKVNGSAAIPTSTQSFGHLATSAPSVYNSSAVSQYTTSNVIRGCSFTANPILEIRVNITGGNCTPADAITQFVFSTIGDAGSTNAATDISKAEIYYADTTQGFSNANFFGSVNNPNGTFTITGSQPLNLGSKTYYFYLTYIVPGTATIGNVLDASMSSFVFNGSTISNMSTPNPAGGRSIVSGTCLNAGDAAPPVTNTQTITAGSLIIPMDNTHQALVAPFNLKAYGLIHQLLLNDVPVKWVIKSGKAKDAPDFIANAGQIYPTVVAAASQTFIASEFVVDSFWVNHSFYPGGQTAAQVMTAFAVPNSVAVYSLTADVAVDVRYTLNHRPKIAVFSNGGNQAIQTTMLTAAGITSNVFVQDAGDFTGLASCYTFCSESHWDFSKNPDVRPVQRVMDFVREGGNFLAQCAGIDLYENHQPSGGHFQTTNGVSFANTTQTNTDYNTDMAFCQYQGGVTPRGGTIASFWLPAGSVYKPETFYGISTPALTNTVVASAVHLADPDSVGSNVFYLGGHSYVAGTIGGDNGIRMYLNATLVPAHRPTAFPIVMSSPTICAGQTVTIGPVPTVGANYIWSPATGLSSATVCNPIASPTTTSVYALTGFNGGCIMGPSTMTVNVNPTPATPTVSSNSPLCTGTTLSLTAAASGTPTFNWSGPNSYTSTTQNPTIANVTSSITGSYSVTATSNSCTSLPGIVSVSVSAPPTTPTAGSNSPVCQGQAINLTASAVAGATYLWSGPNSYTSTSQNPSLTGVLAAAGVYSVTATVAGCVSSISTVTVVVNTTPVMTSTTSATICGGVAVNIPLTSSVGGSTFTWLATDNINTTGESTTSQTTNTLSNTIVNNTASVQTIIYTVTPTAAGCVGASQTVTVTVNPVPVMTNTNSATICSAGTVNIPLTDNVGSTYTWIAADNLNTTGESTTLQTTNTLNNTITNNIVSAQNVIYSVTPTSISGGCLGTSQSITVTVNSTPSATASPSSQSICSNNVTGITLTSNVAGSTFAWTVTQTGVSGASASTGSLIAQTLTATSTSTGSASYTITPTAGSCVGAAQVVSVTVNPTPSVTATPGSQSLCSGNATSISLTGGVAGTTYSWTVSQTGVSGASASTGSTIAQTLSTTGTTLGTAVYTITPSANSCNGSAIVVTVSVNPTPTITATPGTQTLCSGNASSISLTSNVAGTTFSWTVTQTNVTGASAASGVSIAQTLSTTTTSSGTAVYTITSSANSCGGSTQTVTVTVNPTPVMTSTNAGVICSAGTITIPLTSNVASGYTWIAADNVNTTGESTTLQSTNSINNTITNNTTGVQIVVYTVTPTSTAGSCVGAAQVVSVTVNAIPTLTSATTATICSGGTVVLPLSSNVSANYSWIATDNLNTTGESLTAQNTATINNTIISSVGITENVLYNVTPTSVAGSCVGAMKTLTITISPTPAVTLTPSSQVICSGNTATIALSSNVAGTTYSWTVSQSNTSGASAGTGTIISQALTATGLSAGIATYTVTPGIGTCSGSSSVGTITVNPIATVTATPSSQVLCSGNTTAINLSSNIAGTTYSWTVSQTNVSGASASTGSVIAQNLTTTTSSQGTVTYTISSTNNGCSGIPVIVTVSVNPIPTLSVTPTSQVFCTGSTTSLTLSSNVAGTTYSWTVSQTNASGGSVGSGTLIAQTITATSASVGTVVYSVTPTAASCLGTPVVATVSVSPIPATPTPTNNGPICVNGSLNLSVGTIAGASYNWSGPNGFTSAVQNPTITSIPFAGAGVYTVNVTVNGCTGPNRTTTVVVNPPPPTTLTASSNSPLCSSQTLSLTVAPVAAATYSWVGPNSFSSTLQNPTITNASTLATGVYSITATVSGCGSSGTETLSVIVNQTPVAPIATNNGPVCAGATLSLTASGAATTYSWTGPGGFTNNNQNPSITNITLIQAGIYSVSATTNGCTSAFGTTTVVVNPIPATPTISTNAPVCVGQTVNLTTGAVAGATYNWSGPNTFTSSVQNPAITNASTVQSGTYSLSVVVSGCTSATGTINVGVNNAASSPTVSSNSPVCSTDTVHLSAISSVGSTYSWTGPNGFTSTAQNPFIANVTVLANGSYTVVANNGCASTPAMVTVSVTPKPSAPVISSNSPICDGGTLNLTASNTGTSYSWSGPSSYTSSVQNPTITPANLTSAGVYSVVASANGCSSNTGTVNVIVNPIPATPVVGNNSPVCTGQSFNLTVTPVAGASYAWSGPNSYTSSVQSPTVTNVTLSQAGTYSLIVTVNGCSSTTAAITTVTINSTPATPVMTNNGPLCVGATLSLTASGAATTYSWTGPSGFTNNNQNPSITNIALVQAGIYSVSATTNGCTSAFGTTTVVVNPIPATPTISTNAPVCIGQTVNLTTGSVAGATYNWSGPNTYTSSIQNPTITNASTVQSGTYSLSVIVSGCTSATGTVGVAVNTAASSPTVSSNSPVCSGDTLFLSAVSSGGSIYSWSGPNGFTSTSQNPFIVNTTTLVSGTYTVIANNGCASTPAMVTATVNQTPATPTITSNSPVCSGNTLNLSATLLAGGNYNWSGPNGFTATTQNTSVSNMTPAEQGTYSVTVTKNGCTSLVAINNVTVTIPPIANAGLNTTVCANNATVALTGTVSGGSSTGIWTSTGSGTFTPNASLLNTSYIPSNADTTAGSVVLTLTSTNNGGCSASTSSITITITKAPVALAGSNATVCANNANVNLNGIVYGGSSTGIWTTSGTGTFNPNATTLNATYVPSVADITSGSITFTLTTTGNGQCFAASSQMTVTITPAPTTNAGPDQITCKASPNASLNGTVTISNSGTWTTLGSGTFNPNASILNPTYIPSTADTAAGSVLLVLTSSNNGSCLPVTDTVKISFSNIPTVNAGVSQTVCANNAMVALNGIITGGGSTGIWTSSGTGTFVPNPTTLNASYIPSGADTTARSVTLTLTSTSGCVVVASSINLSITPAPFVLAGANISVCSNNALTNYNGSVSGVTTSGIWSTTGSGSFSPNNTILSGNYTPSAADISAGSAYLILTSTNNGNCNATIDTLLLTITPPPAAIAGTNTSICAGNSLVLNGVITGGAGTGVWTTSGSGTFNPNATTLNASYIPSTADTTAHQVVLTLTSTNNGGCLAAVDNFTLTITPAPSISVGVSQTICSSNSVVTLNGQVTVASGLQWTTLGDGTFGAANATSTSYTIGANDITNGQVKVIAISTGNGSCAIVKDSVVINIQKAPVVNAGVNQFVCQGNMIITLAGSVLGTTSTGVWSTSGTGTFGSTTSLNTTYTLSTADTTAGSVKLILASTNNGTCNQASDTVLISITPAGFAYAGRDTIICADVSAVNFSGVVFGGTGAGQWSSSGTGTFTPSNTALNATYAVSAADIIAGTVSIKLTPINSCLPHADSLVMTINPKPLVNAGIDQVICSSVKTVTLSGSVSGGSSTGVWTTIGTGSFSPNANVLNGVYHVSSADSLAGSVKLVLTSTNNGICNSVNDTVKVFITNSTSAMVGRDTTICSIDSLALAGNIIGGSQGLWTSHGTGVFHPSNTALNATYIPSAIDITNGSVIIKLTPTTGCQLVADSLVLTFNLAPIVTAGANISLCISTKTVALSGTVTGGSTTGLWTTSGTGVFSPNDSTLNATYQLSSADSTAGIVTLHLTSTHSSGCGAIKDSLVINTTTPGFAFVNTSMVVCGNNASAVLSGTITGGTGQGLWTSSGSGTFNPLNTSMTPTYVPSAADVTNGSVSIKLTPSNACSPTADSLVLTITPSPTVSAGADVFMCGGLAPINLSGNINTVPTGAIWTTNGTGTFNPNNTTLNPSYVPSVTDRDTIMFILTTTGNGLCNAAFDSMFVYRNVKPVSNFTYSNPCAGQVVTFTDSSIVGAGTITSWIWNFGNGNTSVIQNPTNSFSVAGTYSVSLLINTSQGCSDSITKVLTIHPSPISSFSFAASCSNDSVRFVNSSSVASGTISSWSWNFGDTHVSTLQNPAHLFDSIKVYNVSLVVTSDLGCVSTITQTLSVIPAPIAGFSLQSTCGSLFVNFKDTTIVNSGTITNWNWTFGDGHVAATQNPSNTYSVTGAYTVTLQVQTSNGCKDTASAVVNLSPSILANYTPHGGAYHITEEIAFTNQSTGATGYVWNFGDGSSTSTTTDPMHAFGSSGSYSVTLIASNSLGCVDTVAYVFDVKTSGYTVPEGFTPNGDGINDGFFVLGGPFSGYELRVFNEWGNQIFISNSQTDKWDGTYKGSIQPAGTYVYIFNGKIVDGDDVKLKGEVNLIR